MFSLFFAVGKRNRAYPFKRLVKNAGTPLFAVGDDAVVPTAADEILHMFGGNRRNTFENAERNERQPETSDRARGGARLPFLGEKLHLAGKPRNVAHNWMLLGALACSFDIG